MSQWVKSRATFCTKPTAPSLCVSTVYLPQSSPKAFLLFPSERLRKAFPEAATHEPCKTRASWHPLLYNTISVPNLVSFRSFLVSTLHPSWPCLSLLHQSGDFCGIMVSQLSYSLYLGVFLHRATGLAHTYPSSHSWSFVLGEDLQFLHPGTPERTSEMSEWSCIPFLVLSGGVALWVQGPGNSDTCSTMQHINPLSLSNALSNTT